MDLFYFFLRLFLLPSTKVQVMFLIFFNLLLYFLKSHLENRSWNVKGGMNQQWHLCLEFSFISAFEFEALAQAFINWGEDEITSPGPALTSPPTCRLSYAQNNSQSTTMVWWSSPTSATGTLLAREMGEPAQGERWLTPTFLLHAMTSPRSS